MSTPSEPQAPPKTPPTMPVHAMRALFQPKRVALVGASARPDSLGHAVLANLLAGGIGEALALVNPRYERIDDRVCAPSLSALEYRPDLVLIATPPAAVMAVVEEAARLGCPAAIVMTADGAHGADSLQGRLKALAAATGIRIVGPNCLGLIAPPAHLNASFIDQPVQPGDLAVISQSGAIVTALAAWAGRRHIGFSGLVSVGDMADVDFADLLDYFALDAGTRAILLYVESIQDAKSFMSAARAAARVKPVLVVKAGRSEKAAKAAATHTGALAGSDAVYDAAFRRAGLLRLDDLDEMFDAAETLARVKPFAGKRLAILTNGGGMGVLAVDRLMDLGGDLATLTPTTLAALDQHLPAGWSHANPVDIIGDADPARFAGALKTLMADPANDAVLVIHCPTAMAKSAETAQAVIAACTQARAGAFTQKPVLALWPGADGQTNALFEAAGIPHYERGAVTGFMQMVHWRANRDALMRTPPAMPEDSAPDVAKARALMAAALAREAAWLDPVEITGLLEAFGIPAATARLATTPDEAAQIAGPLIADHGACVVKILSPQITHKSDIGGVRLDLRTPEAVREAAAEMFARAARERPDAQITGVTLHPMVKRPHARELIAGLAEDPTFGPVLVFGRGGTAVEVINDRALAFPPLDLAMARDLMERTRVIRVLRHYRDVPAADLDAVAMTIVQIARMSVALPEIVELDLNPLLADENGVIVLDARVAIRTPAMPMRDGVNPRLAIMPCPAGLDRHIQTRDGRSVHIRPVHPEDEDMYRHFFETSVTAEDLRLRFFAPVQEFSHAFVARLTQIDYARTLALCALDEQTGAMLGGVRLMYDAARISGEYAILLASDMKGQGLGLCLMELMIEEARRIGLHRVEGQVLADNTAMLALCEQLGFVITPDREDPGIRQVVLETGGGH